MKHAYFGLGSNLGDRQANLRRAVHSLHENVSIQIRELSPVYETAPWGDTNQPNFLNMVVSANTSLAPLELLKTLKEIEGKLGRVESRRWGPRQIDIDILFLGDTVVEESGEGERTLRIPHSGVEEREFVLRPLAELAPNLTHPRTGRTVSEMLAAIGSGGAIQRLPLPLEWGWRTYVMGIINVTPDSFSGDGLMRAGDEAQWLSAVVAQAQQFVRDGCDILDIGGESTRPGSTPVSASEEEARIIPAVKALREIVEIPISVDTYRASVASAALDAGANWVNDVWGLRMDPELADVVAQAGCPVVLMHNRSQPKNVEQQERLGGRYVGIHYDDLIGDVKRELLQSVSLAKRAGIAEEKIILDPGIGFGKTVAQNLELIDKLDQIKELGYPLLLGTSRKSFIGYTLDLPPEERMEGTAGTVAIGIDRGADIVRVHDVQPIKRVVQMVDSIVRHV